MTAFDWITPLYQVTRDALTDGQLVALSIDYYHDARSAVERLGIESWAWSISDDGTQVVFSVRTEDMAQLAAELGFESAPKSHTVTVLVALLMWGILAFVFGGTAYVTMLLGG